jgi:hypothetical protein
MKAMQHVDGFGKSDRVDRPICVAIVVLNHFQDSRTSEALERLSVRVLAALLSLIKSKPNLFLHLVRKASEVL